MGDDTRRDGEGTPAPGAAPAPRAGDKRPRVAARRWGILVGGAGVVVLGVITLIVWTAGGPPAGPDPVIYTEGHNPFLEAEGAACIGMPLGRGPVVYGVDSSSALDDSFDAIRSAVGRSLATLSTRQRFGLVVWTEGQSKVLAMAGNTPAGRAAAIHLLDEVQPSGSTDAAAGIRAAVKLRSKVLCIIAAKGPPEGDIDSLAMEIRDAGIVLRCIAVRDDAPTLSALAEKTGGSYQLIDPQELEIWLGESQ